jgi:hypothetical protein
VLFDTPSDAPEQKKYSAARGFESRMRLLRKLSIAYTFEISVRAGYHGIPRQLRFPHSLFPPRVLCELPAPPIHFWTKTLPYRLFSSFLSLFKPLLPPGMLTRPTDNEPGFPRTALCELPLRPRVALDEVGTRYVLFLFPVRFVRRGGGTTELCTCTEIARLERGGARTRRRLSTSGTVIRERGVGGIGIYWRTPLSLPPLRSSFRASPWPSSATKALPPPLFLPLNRCVFYTHETNRGAWTCPNSSGSSR